MTAVLIALAVFFTPPALGLISPRHMAGVWLTAALCAVVVCVFLNQPLGFAAAIQSVMLAVIAVGVSPSYPSLRQRRRQRKDREMEALDRKVAAFIRELDDADTDLAARIWTAPRPRLPRVTPETDPGPGAAP